MKDNKERVVSAENFCATLAENTDNEKVSDADFRQFVRNTLPIVIYSRKDEKGERR
jgi:hypothetical protein